MNAPQWANALWNRLSSLIEDMAGACVKVRASFCYYFEADLDCCDLQVYTLEKVLKLKKDPVSQIVFLDEAMKVGSVVLPHPWLLRHGSAGAGKQAKHNFLGCVVTIVGKANPGRGEK